MNVIKYFLSNKTTLAVLKSVLGFIFVIASLGKIIDPAGFTNDVYSYVILPSSWVASFATVIPWIEFFAGLLLMLDVFPRSSVLIILGLLIAFITAIYLDVHRGVEISCGCFDFLFPKELIGWNTIWRDIIMFVTGVPILFFDHNSMKLYGMIKKKQVIVKAVPARTKSKTKV
jgi:uncharacterized membrane protein YphA (DoxX/SURF4 family)